MADSSDLFPLTPFYPVKKPQRISMKDRYRMGSGKPYIATTGTDLKVWEITGRCTVAEEKALEEFYEAHAECGCTFRDAGYDPPEDYFVDIEECPEIVRNGYENVTWTARLIERPT